MKTNNKQLEKRVAKEVLKRVRDSRRFPENRQIPSRDHYILFKEPKGKVKSLEKMFDNAIVVLDVDGKNLVGVEVVRLD